MPVAAMGSLMKVAVKALICAEETPLAAAAPATSLGRFVFKLLWKTLK